MPEQEKYVRIEDMKTIEFTPTNYPSDLSDKEWEQIAELFPQGPNSEHHKRSLINAVFYIVDNGNKWRALPHDFPPYSTVSTFYRRARMDGLWAKLLNALVKRTRLKEGRNESPSYGIIDSQSVKTIYASEERGIDGGKKRKAEKGTLSWT